MATLKCVCCDKALTPVQDEPECFQPELGVTCTARGNFGSTVFDPLAIEERGNELLFFLCDTCLVAKRESIYLLRVKRRKPTPATNYLSH